MSDAATLKRLAMALDGTVMAPHFDRLAFKVDRNYATLAADGATANLKLTPDQQLLKCATAPEAFTPVPGAWGAQGWTTVDLAALSAEELADALRLAWSRAIRRKAASKRRTPR